MAYKTSFVIIKGGQAKSKSAVNVADALAMHGKRTLVVDGDLQGTTTKFYGHDPIALQQQELSLDFALFHYKPITDIILHNGEGKPDLIACYPAKDEIEVGRRFDEPVVAYNDAGEAFVTRVHEDNEMLLKHALAPLESLYDHIIFDTPGSINFLTSNVLAASDGAIIPVEPEKDSLESLGAFAPRLNETIARVNPRLHLFGFLPTRYRKVSGAHNEILAILRSNRLHVFDPVPLTTFFTNVLPDGVSTTRVYPNHEAVQPYIALAKYLINYYES